MPEEIRYLSELESDYDKFDEAIKIIVEKLEGFNNDSKDLNMVSNYFTIDGEAADNGEFYRKRELLYDYQSFIENNFHNAIVDEEDRIDNERVEYYQTHGN